MKIQRKDTSNKQEKNYNNNNNDTISSLSSPRGGVTNNTGIQVSQQMRNGMNNMNMNININSMGMGCNLMNTMGMNPLIK